MRHQDNDLENVHFHFHLDGNININAGCVDNSEVLAAIQSLRDALDHSVELQAEIDARTADEQAAIDALAEIGAEVPTP